MSKEKQKLFDGIRGTRPGHVSLEVAKIEDSDIEQVRALHKSLLVNTFNIIKSAIMIGEILSRKKRELKHGEFIPWIESNFEFTRRTASGYIRVFEGQEKLNGKSISHLTDALKMLSAPEIEEKEINPLRSMDLIYRDWKDGKPLPKNEKQTLKTWIHEKAEKLRTKAEELDKEARKIK